MPPKKRKPIGKVTPKARKSKEMRRQETPEQRERRLANLRKSAAKYLASETPEQRKARLEFLRRRSAAIRASETPEQREIRREFNRKRAAAIRASETPEQREVRLRHIRERAKAIRASETPEQREARLQYKREAIAAKRRETAAASRVKAHSSIPQDADRRQLWVRNIGRVKGGITKFSKVCSKHFTSDSFDPSKFGGTWLKPTAVPTLFDISEHSRAIDNGEASTSQSGTPRTGREYYLGDFEYEETGEPEKSGGKALSQPAPAAESVPPFEPEIVIKEEPIDIDESQLPSTSRTADEFILPGPSRTGWTGHAPSLGEAFSVAKTPSNGKTEKKAGQSEESEDDSKKAKDHFDAYGEYIAAKLRKLDWKSCAYVQKAIGDILFEAEMGKYK